MEINTEYREKVSSALNAWIDNTGKDKERSGSKLSQKTGVNAAVISLIKRGIYQNGNTTIPEQDFMKLGSFLEVPNGVKRMHFNTSNFIRVQMMADRFQREMVQGFLDSETPGAGKTYSLEIAAKQFKKVVYYKTTTTTSTTTLLRGVMMQLGWKPVFVKRREKRNRRPGYKEVMKEKRMSSAERIEWLREKIEYGTLLIVDELETVKNKNDVYGTLKDLVDMAVGRFGMIASGYGIIDYFKQKADKGRQGYAQLYSRLEGVNITLEAISEQAIGEMIREKGGKAYPDVCDFVSRHVEDYRRLAPVMPVLIEISKIQTAKERKLALESIFNHRVEVTAEARNKYAL